MKHLRDFSRFLHFTYVGTYSESMFKAVFCVRKVFLIVLVLMKEILHQLIGGLSSLSNHLQDYIPGGAGFLPSTVVRNDKTST